MDILIDKRIELMTIVQTLCNYWDDMSMNFANGALYQCKYKENIKSYFGKYREHEIIELYNVISKDVLQLSAFIDLALCYSDPLQLSNIADYEYHCKSNYGEISNSAFPFEEFISKLRQFNTDTDFEMFYENNKDEYACMMNDYGDKSRLSEDTVLDYLGSKLINYNVIISPLVMGCFGIKIKTNKNEMLNYSVISPYDYKENRYIFGNINFDNSIIWHEICHLFINDLTKNYLNEFNVDEEQIPEIFVKNFYTTVESIINEYIIRAITIRLFEMKEENKFADFLAKRDIEKGFEDIESVKKYIKENCEVSNRFIKDSSYKNLMEFIIAKI
jgi:hypothetical protein